MRTILSMVLFVVSLQLSSLALTQAIPTEQLFRDFDTHRVTLSPDGRYLATFSREEDRTLISFTYTDSMIQHEIISFAYNKTARLLDVEWLDNETLLIDYHHKKNRDRLQAILPIKFKDDGTPYTKAKRIWAKGYIVDKLADRPGSVLFTQNEGTTSDREYKLYYVSYKSLLDNKVSANGIPFPIQPQSSFFVFSSQSDKELLSTSVNRDNETVDIHIFLHGMKDWKLATRLKLDEFNFNPIAIIDDNTLAVLSNNESDLNGLYEYNLKTKKLGKLIYAHPKYDLVGATLTAQTKSLESVSYYDHGKLVNQYFSKTQSILKKKLDRAFPGQQLVIAEQGSKRENILLVVFSSNNPGQYYLYNRKIQKAELVAERLNDIDKTQLSKSRHISIVNENGQEIESILTSPIKNSNNVLIVNPHGGPIGVRDREHFDRQAQFLVNRGFSLLQVNFRGSWGFGKKFLEAGVAQFGKAIEKDINATVDHVLKENHYKNICAMGSSYGGYSSVMLAIQKPRRYDCVIAAFGVYDLPLIFNSRNVDEIDGSIESYEKILGNMRDELWDLSPLYQAEKLQAPTLLIAGYKDNIAPIEQSNRFKMRLEQLGKPLETLFYKNSGHGHNHWDADAHQLLYVDDFIRRSLNLPSVHHKNDKELLISDYRRIADGLSADSMVEQQGKRAFENYMRAAELGHARSQFNVASYFHSGDGIEKDLENASHWYKKSAENGYHKGYLRLAHLHRRGVISKANKETALRYFEEAAKAEIETAEAYVARAYCFGEGVAKNIKSCLEKLEVFINENFKGKTTSKSLMTTTNNIIAEISWRISLDKAQLELIKEMLGHTNSAKIFGVKVNEEESGTYLKDSNGYYSFKESETTIPLKLGASFGSLLEVSGYPRSESNYGKMTAVKVKWSSPIEIDEDGASVAPTYYIHFSRYSSEYYFIREIKENWQLVPGTWTLELESLDGKSLYKQEFEILNEEKMQEYQNSKGLNSLFQ